MVENVTGQDERSPLLQGQESQRNERGKNKVFFSEKDPANPRAWTKSKKLGNIAVIASMAIFSPLASSMFAPGIDQIAESLHVDKNSVIGCQTGFVVMLGIGPLFLAPLSETFGRKKLYLVCFLCFTLLQIPTALAPNLPTLIALRTFAGFFGSVGIANGGGTISDMYEPSERAGVFGWYLLGPLLGPTLGPLFGGIIMENLEWPWLFWILTMASSVVVVTSFIFLHETYVPILLLWRKKELEQNEGCEYHFDGEDDRPLHIKLGQSFQRPLRILFTQPIVLTMASYQALIFATTYSLYTQFQTIYGVDSYYGLSTLQVGLLYLFPGLGFLVAVRVLVPRIDTVYNSLTRKHNGEAKPEYRLPLACVGSILIPVSLFWFAWSVQAKVHWSISIVATFFYGIGQVAVFNCAQNYYIDSFEKYAASAIAAGALFRSVIGGVVPLFTPMLLEKYGVGWGMSMFAFIGVALAPSPLFFWYYGEWLRERFAIEF
ncbi:membrane transporter-2 [Coleophoma cylindrospora]|uniref:Membrane transporter-2 n=1 Tax=Coleophoma cylindrospora TaxID=1849047 RepID=A0A3D8SFJ4_9HELO|nr:membrane transporter-2 [Coleophoma cylindrospora]